MERGNVANTPQAGQPAPGRARTGATLDPGPATSPGGGPSAFADQRGPGRVAAVNPDGTSIESVVGEDGLRTVTVRDADGRVTDEWMQAPLNRSGASISSTETHPDGSRTTTEASPGGSVTSTYDPSGELLSERVSFDDGSSAETVRLGPNESEVTTTNADGSTVTEHIVDGDVVSISRPNPDGSTDVWVEVVIGD